VSDFITKEEAISPQMISVDNSAVKYAEECEVNAASFSSVLIKELAA